MSGDDKATALGRLLMEKKEVKEHLALLEAEAKRVGQELENLGASLQSGPSYVLFDGQSADIKYTGQGVHLYNPKDADSAKLMKLVDEIRLTLRRFEDLSAQASNLGF